MNNKFIVFFFHFLFLASCAQKLETSIASSNSINSDANQTNILPKSESESADDSLTATTGSNGSNSGGNQNSGGTGGSTLSPQECYFNYISVFNWENANASDAFSQAPILSAQKIASLKVYNQVGNTALRDSLSFTADTEWKYYFILSQGTAAGSTSLSSFLNKKNQSDASTELTCGFGPSLDSNYNITDPSSRIVYQNIGVGLNGIDGQTGFLSHKDKFIVCKFTKGSQGVLFYGENTQVTVNQAFVIKRGCYQ